MNNFRESLVQIIDVIGLPAWKDGQVDDFLAIAEVEAMVDLLEALPKDKQGPIIQQMFAPNKTPRDVERVFGSYYKPRHDLLSTSASLRMLAFLRGKNL